MNGLEILHVEDDPHCVELTQRALRKLPQPVAYQAVADAEQALTFLAARARLPHLLLLDLRLPKSSGLQLLETLRTDTRLRALPVVMFTSSQERGDVAEAYRLGTNSYVVKPVEYREYLATIAQLVDYWFGVNYQNP